MLADLEPSLQQEVLAALHRDVVASVPLLQFCAPKTQEDICFRLRPVFAVAPAAITAEGSLPDALYIVRFGSVVLSVAGRQVDEAQPGSLFGELALLGLTQDGKRARTAKAKTMCELCMLQRADFEHMLRVDASFFSVVTRVVKCHVASLRRHLTVDNALPRERYISIDWKSVGRVLEHDAASEARRREFRNPRTWEAAQKPGVLATTVWLDVSSVDVCICLCICKCVYMHMCISVHVNVYVYICTCVHLSMYMYVCIYVYVYMCICEYTHTHKHTHTHTHDHTHTSTHTNTHTGAT